MDCPPGHQCWQFQAVYEHLPDLLEYWLVLHDLVHVDIWLWFNILCQLRLLLRLPFLCHIIVIIKTVACDYLIILIVTVRWTAPPTTRSTQRAKIVWARVQTAESSRMSSRWPFSEASAECRPRNVNRVSDSALTRLLIFRRKSTLRSGTIFRLSCAMPLKNSWRHRLITMRTWCALGTACQPSTRATSKSSARWSRKRRNWSSRWRWNSTISK